MAPALASSSENKHGRIHEFSGGGGGGVKNQPMTVYPVAAPRRRLISPVCVTDCKTKRG